MKKIAILSLVLTLAFVATPVFARGGGYMPMQGSSITVTNMNMGTTVMNSVEVEAETGDNEVEGKGMIITGDATAISYIGNEVNSNRTIISGVCANCMGNVKVTNFNLGTSVMNDVEVEAETGDNEVKSLRSRCRRTTGGGLIITGDAGAQSDVVNILNSSVTRVTLLGGIR